MVGELCAWVHGPETSWGGVTLQRREVRPPPKSVCECHTIVPAGLGSTLHWIKVFGKSVRALGPLLGLNGPDEPHLGPLCPQPSPLAQQSFFC